MRVFLSWSGRASKLVAEGLRDWLPNVIQAIEPWLSSEDIPLGVSWQSEISDRLQTSAAGIICITRENAGATWLNYEAGSLSRRDVLVCPYLLDLEPSELEGPLIQFQSAKADRHDTLALVRSLNDLAANQKVRGNILLHAFETYWPSLEKRLQVIRESLPKASIKLSADDKLNEILVLLRSLVEKGMVSEPIGRPAAKSEPNAKPRVFIGSSTEGLNVAELIQLGLEEAAECTLWTQSTFAPGQTFIESIVDATLRHDFAVLILTPDDLVIKRGLNSSSPRDNIIFELGLFTGALGRARTFMVVPRDTRMALPSDLAGVTSVNYATRSDGNLEAALGPVCTRIKQAMGVA